MEISKLSKLYAKHPLLYNQHREKYSSKTTPYSIISIEPPIFYIKSFFDQSGHASLQPLFDYLQNRTAYFLKSWSWHIENINEVEKISNSENQHITQYPKHKIIHLCNTVEQQEIFHKNKLNAIFCNQNCLIDEKIFNPITGIVKEFNAVYDAKFTTFKRHYLAEKIDNLAFIYYYDLLNDIDCYQEILSLFPHARYFNQALAKNNKFLLSPYQVNQCLNACKVGLCLSSVEGAMYASIQYLLSGLPVVSTKSKGGRDIFFDEEFTLIVEDDSDAIKEGVDELIRRNISAETIRAKVLKKIKEHRLILIKLVQSIYEQEGIEKDFSVEWESLFYNKLMKLQTPEQAIQQFELAKQNIVN